MKVFYLLSLIGLIACSSVFPKVVDIWYNYEYQLLRDYSSAYNDYAFRLPVIPGDKMDIEIKLAKGDNNNFVLYFYGFSYNPSDQEIFNYKGTPLTISSQYYYYEGSYIVYAFTIQAPTGCTYFGIHLTTSSYYAYSYLTLRVNIARYKYSVVHDLSSTKTLLVDTSIFGDGYIPVQYRIFIKSRVNPGQYMAIQLNTKYNYDRNYAFQVDVCEFYGQPTDAQVYYGYGSKRCLNTLVNYSYDANYYTYYFTADRDINYVSIRIINNCQNLDYLNIYVGPSYQK